MAVWSKKQLNNRRSWRWTRTHSYLSQADALAKNITYANGNTFIMRSDDTTVLTASGPGRDAVRIQSNAQYSTHVVVWVNKYELSLGVPSSCTLTLGWILDTCLKDARKS